MTWKRLTGGGLPAGMTGRVGLAVAASNPQRVYALIESKDGILWRSDDAGATWKLMTKNTLVDQRPFYFSHVSVDPSNADHVYGVSEELSESKDGGKTFKAIASQVHVDYHDMWIAPNDPRRMIAGEDGGYALTTDGGAAWSFSRNLAIGQIYHVGYDDRTPYRICMGLQDNNGFCGPSNSLNPEGIIDESWERVIGGDGIGRGPTRAIRTWCGRTCRRARLDLRPHDPAQHVRAAVARPRDRRFPARPGGVPLQLGRPLAFDPFDRTTTYFGANVVFATRDRGAHGGRSRPTSRATTSRTSSPRADRSRSTCRARSSPAPCWTSRRRPKTRGEIGPAATTAWCSSAATAASTGRNVTPPGVAPDGRAEMISPSSLVAGTAYAVIDRHLLGDYAPYVFVTHDWGAHWTRISEGLPAQSARAIRPDTRNPHLVYLGSRTRSGCRTTTARTGASPRSGFRRSRPTTSACSRAGTI